MMRKWFDGILTLTVLSYTIYAQVNNDHDLRKLRKRISPYKYRVQNRVKRFRTWWKLGDPAYAELREYSVREGSIPLTESE